MRQGPVFRCECVARLSPGRLPLLHTSLTPPAAALLPGGGPEPLLRAVRRPAVDRLVLVRGRPHQPDGGAVPPAARPAADGQTLPGALHGARRYRLLPGPCRDGPAARLPGTSSEDRSAGVCLFLWGGGGGSGGIRLACTVSTAFVISLFCCCESYGTGFKLSYLVVKS